MHTLIRILASAIARRIESGSRRAALWGALIAIVLSLILWLIFCSNSDFSVACAIVLVIYFAIGGALTGSCVPASQSPRTPEILRPQERIRLSNFNYSLVPPILFLVGCAGTALAAAALFAGEMHSLANIALGLLVPAGTAILGFVCLRTIYWVDITTSITLQRLFAHRSYPPSAIRSWTIVPAEDTRSLELSINFDDKYVLAYHVPAAKVQLVTARLCELAPDAMATRAR